MAHLDYSIGQPETLLRPGQRVYARLGKRLVDIVLATAILPVLLPIIAVLWLITRRDGAAGFFAHTRVGRNGKPFRCWKIRTMVPDAETRLETYLQSNPQAADEWARTQKLTHDPRVTPLGRFLRRTSLDELPQIWNVMRGDMSFVGPRPVTLPELERYGLHSHVYLSLRPGVTGLWQVMGRSNGCYTERTNMDRAYASSLGLIRDLSLILRTGLVVFLPTGR